MNNVFRVKYGNKQVDLLPHQINHFNKINLILKTSFFYLDTSSTGSGKTYSTAAIAINNGMDVFVVCPKIVGYSWKNCSLVTGFNIRDTVSYESFRSTRGSQPKKYLSRQDYTKRTEFKEYEFTDFSPTTELEELWDSGILIVFDEVHKAIGNTATMKAISTVVEMGLKRGGKSRIAFLSATAFDQERGALIFFKLLGLVPSELEFVAGREAGSVTSRKCISQIVSFCNQIDPINTQDLITSNVSSTSYKLFINIIKPSIHSEMPPPVFDFGFNYRKVFFKTDVDEIFSYISHLNKLLAQNTDPDDKKRQEINMLEPNDKITRIIYALNKINSLKLPILKRIILHRLITEPTSKIVVFSDTIEMLLKPLGNFFESQGFPVLFLTGTNENKKLRTQEEIESIIEKFNAFDTTNRILLSTTSKGGVGINLHDTSGEFPRYTYMLPSFRLRDLHQAAGRCYRVGVKSISTITLVLVQTHEGNESERTLLNNMSRKTEILKSLNDMSNIGNERGKILYPGDYPEHIETELEYQSTLDVADDVEFTLQ